MLQFCVRVDPTIKQLQDVYKDNIQIVWKHYPLASIHRNAMEAAVAAEAAHNQVKFVSGHFHDKLFASQSELVAPPHEADTQRTLGLEHSEV